MRLNLNDFNTGLNQGFAGIVDMEATRRILDRVKAAAVLYNRSPTGPYRVHSLYSVSPLRCEDGFWIPAKVAASVVPRNPGERIDARADRFGCRSVSRALTVDSDLSVTVIHNVPRYLDLGGWRHYDPYWGWIRIANYEKEDE